MPTKTRPHRSLPALIIVVALIVAGSPAASARAIASATPRNPDRAEAAVLAAQSAPGAVTATGPDYDNGPTLRNGLVVDRAPVVPAIEAPEESAQANASSERVGRVAPTVPAPKAKSESTAEPKGSGGSGTGSASYTGRNRVWIPALGIARSTTGFACTSTAYPGDRVYKWGCAGRNNVYLFGHAHSVFKPLHDAYVRGRLAKGMKVYYADNKGRVSTYSVIWWKVTTPDKGAFAYAAQSKPSMTLQTCVGAKSQYRLIVRLAKVG